LADDNTTPDVPAAPVAAEPMGKYSPAAPAEPVPVGFEVADEKGPNFMVGLAAAIGLGLVAALLYAGVAILAEREFAILAVLIGIAVAYGFLRFGRTKGVLAGLVAAVIAIALYFVAIFVTTAGLWSKESGESFLDSLSLMLQNTSLVVEVYFEDPLSYVFIAISAIIAFVYAAGLAGRKLGRG
jgi:hypothetical protein